MDYKNLIGYAASVLAVIGYIPYFVNIYRGKTKPHAFSWLIWGILNAIGVAIQLSSHGGAGAWAIMVTCVLNFVVAGIGFYQRQVIFVLFDWLSLMGAVLAIVLWWFTSNPLWAAVLISAADGLGLLPSMRKAYYKPNEETIFGFALGVIIFLLAIVALDSRTVVNWFYPATIVFGNACFVMLVLSRRNHVRTLRPA